MTDRELDFILHGGSLGPWPEPVAEAWRDYIWSFGKAGEELDRRLCHTLDEADQHAIDINADYLRPLWQLSIPQPS